MAEGEVQQYFVRNDKGLVWGPLALTTIELLVDNGIISGKVQISEDGLNFAFPGRFPHLRDAFPREMWGDVVVPGPTAPATPRPAIEVPPEVAAAQPAAAPVAGPGVAPRTGPGAAPIAGPGVAPRPGPGIAARGATPASAPGVRLHSVAPGARPAQAPGAPKPPPAVAAGAPVARPVAATPPSATAKPAPAAPTAAAPKLTQSFNETAGSKVPSQGELGTLTPVNLYGRLAAGGHTGLLSLRLADRTVHIHFRKGNPEFIDSTHSEDALGTVLVNARMITAEQLQQAEAARERFGGDLLAALFGSGILQPATAFTQLAQRATHLLYKGLYAEAGSFTYEEKELPPQKAMPLGNRWALLSDFVRRIPAAELKRRLYPALQLPIMKSGGLVAPTELRLTPHEVRVLGVIDGVRSLTQLARDMPQDVEHLLRVAYLLKELDGVSFAAVRTPPPAAAPKPAAPEAKPPAATTPPPAAAPKPPPTVAAKPAAPKPPPAVAAKPAAAPAAPKPPPTVAAKPAAPSAPAAPAAPSAPATVDLAALRQQLATLKEQNHFERLGLKQDAEGSAVKIAYFRLAKLYHPDTLPPGASPEQEKLTADIFAAIGDAYRVLSDDKSRKEYLEELKAGGSGGEVDVAAILQAEELFRKGTIFVKNRKYAEAVGFFNEAISLNAEEPEFHIWRAYARFLSAPDKKTAQPAAFREIQDALKKNERIAPGHYFLGVIAKMCGDASGALKHFKRCVEIQPDHIDAQREIRLAAQKK